MDTKGLTHATAIGVAACAAAAFCAAPLVGPARPEAPRSAQPVTASASNWSDGKWGDATADDVAKDAYGKHAAQQDPGSLFTVEKAIGVRGAWGKHDRNNLNVTGQGIGVALLDSGINSAVPGLNLPGKVTYGPDLSIEANGPLVDQDTYGHGTFLAGIIAGRGATNPSADLPGAPANVQLGVAPDAKLLAVKLATTDGSTDVSQVIAGIDWVVEHPVLPDGTRIRVINLAYGTDSAQSYQVDPLAAAAENAWRQGIVVVTSAGNSGASTGRLTDPAIDPYVLAVAAADSSDRLDGWAHDHTRAASYSNVSSTGRHPDLLAPGTSLVSLRDPGSFVDANHPEGRVSGDTTGTLFRGSGTSQAAAVVSGAVADLLQAYPSLTPDQVKYALTSSAEDLANANNNAAAVGAGILNLPKAMDTAQHLTATDSTATQLRAAAVQTYPQASGTGSIEAARAGSTLIDADGNEITGEVDVQGNPWDGTAWYRAATTLTAWSGGQWLGSTWTGTGWQTSTDDNGLNSTRWASARWASARWASARWADASWTSARWASARWASARWASARWADTSWS